MARLVLGDRTGFESDVDMLERRTIEFQSLGLRNQLALRRAAVALLDGRFDELEGLASTAMGIPSDPDHGLGPWAIQMCKLTLEQGRAGEFEGEIRRVLTSKPGNSVLVSMLPFALAEMGEHDEALRLFGELAADDFVRVTRRGREDDGVRLPAEVVTALDDLDGAGRLYELYLPYSGLVVASGLVAHCPGAVDRYLGQMAATLGRWDEAEKHYEAALDLETGLRSPPLLARTRYWYGRMLVGRGRPGDGERARDLLKSALDTAELLGMARLAAQASELA